MNAHQRRKAYRKLIKSFQLSGEHYFIKDWDDLAQVPESDTHRLEIDIEGGNGYIKDKSEKEDDWYLSTHTFYGSQHKQSTIVLREHGFNVTLDNWDKEEIK